MEGKPAILHNPILSRTVDVLSTTLLKVVSNHVSFIKEKPLFEVIY